MYPAFFGLKRRPFSPVPNPACLARVDSAEVACATLGQCLELGRGIAVLTAPAGLGKTLICRRLAAALGERFAVAVLPASPAPTRRALLQTILYEIGHQHLRADEGELRLRLRAAIQQLPPRRAGLVLILDEAHLVPERLLEELRALTTLSADGEPLVRLLLSGQLTLEEQLASPMLADLSQRVGCHCTLGPLTQEESHGYLAARVAWAGGRASDIFTPEALRLITRASDGSPRALNLLSEECLLIAARRQERPVCEATVRESLRELQQLPLHWNVSFAIDAQTQDRTERPAPSDAAQTASTVEFGGRDGPFDPDVIEDQSGSLEFGFDEELPAQSPRSSSPIVPIPPSLPAAAPGSGDSPSVGRSCAASAAAPAAVASPALPCGCHTWNACLCNDDLELAANEERVIDRYALIDAGRPAPELPPPAARTPIGPDGVIPEVAELRSEESRIPAIARPSLMSCDSEDDAETLGVVSGSAPCESRQTHGLPPRLQLIDSTPIGRETADSTDDVEMRIGSSVLETCLAAQRAIRQRIESILPLDEPADEGVPPAATPRPRLLAGSAENPNDRSNAAASHRANGRELGIRRDDGEPHEPRPPRRRFERLFSDLRRRSREA